MINVEQIYQSLRDLSTKGKGGYSDTDEFNKNSKRAELLLWQYYFSIFEATRRVPEAMLPFMTESALGLDTNGAFDLPTDFGHMLNVQYGTVKNGATCGDDPVVSNNPVYYLQKSELTVTLSSLVRGPSLAKKQFYYSFSPSKKAQVYPVKMTGQVAIQYLRLPNFAIRAFTLDTTNDEQVYNAGASVQYEWQTQEENNLVDILLMFQGVIIRDNALIQWAASHQSVTDNLVK